MGNGNENLTTIHGRRTAERGGKGREQLEREIRSRRSSPCCGGVKVLLVSSRIAGSKEGDKARFNIRIFPNKMVARTSYETENKALKH